jgi:Icc-related predicted phosphoesterase
MKILAFSDIHGDTTLAKKLAEQAEREHVDLVILAGDITFAEQSTDNIIGPFAARGKKVVIIPGNHETIATVDFLAEMYGAVNLHGYAIKYKDIGFFGCGGAEIGPFPISEKDIEENLKKAHEMIKDSRVKIMITHAHPADSKIGKFSPFVRGSEAVRKAIYEFKPDIMFCGHVHEAEGIEEIIGKTRVINVGKHGKILDV